MAYLTVETDEGSYEPKELSETVIIGRSPECALHFDDRLLSRRHVKLEKSAEGWHAIDLGSTNGTLVGGQRITHHLLLDGDVIRAGALVFRFNREVRAQSDAESVSLLQESEIEEILNQPDLDLDSIDEEWEERSVPVLHEPAARQLEPASATLSEPADDLGRKTDRPSLWEIAMKPASAVGSADAGRRSGNSLLLRFGTNQKLKRAATLSVIAILVLGGYFCVGSNSNTRSAALQNQRVQAPARNRNGAFDLPV